MKSWQLNRKVKGLSMKLEDSAKTETRLDYNCFSEPERKLLDKVQEIVDEYAPASPPQDIIEKNADLWYKGLEIFGRRATELFVEVLPSSFCCDELEEWYFKVYFYNFWLDWMESVKEALAKMTVTENTKFLYSCAYTRFLSFLGKTWKPPKYDFVEKLPEFLPTEIELDQLIAGCGKRTSALLQLMKETGMRLGECLRLTWICINVDMRIITLTHAEKHSSPRVFDVSPTLIGMLNSLPKQNDKVFGKMNKSSATTCLINQRKRISKRLNNPRIAKIHYHLIRHWYATLLYHKTRDIHYVAQMLGHKHTMTTEIYINMEKMAFNLTSNEYTVKVASTLEEACQLLEVGFEYVTEMGGHKLFRKRK